jgi:hypothetical protein
VPFQIHVTAPPGSYLKAIRLGDRPLPTPELDAAKSTGPLQITLATDGGALDGAVIDAQGSPLEGAAVLLVPDGRLREWTDLTRSAVTGKEGKFELRDIAPGDYKIFALEDAESGAHLDPDFQKPFEKQATAVRIAPNGRDTLEVKALLPVRP